MSLLFGLSAAVAWAMHDLLVRYVSQRTAILPALLTVLVAGALFFAPVAAVMGDWQGMTLLSYGLGAVSGLSFALGSLSLYHAFAIGPVRLVAPIIGSYPVLSVGWAAINGAPISPLQWVAVFIIALGVALVASLSDTSEGSHQRASAILFSVLAGSGFAFTFATGQAATRLGADLPVILVARVTALALIGGLMLVLQSSARPEMRLLPLLAAMGALDATALGLVIAAGSLPSPEFAAVASSLFGMLTVVFAWAVLRESMTVPQWAAVGLVFCGIGYLGL